MEFPVRTVLQSLLQWTLLAHIITTPLATDTFSMASPLATDTFSMTSPLATDTSSMTSPLATDTFSMTSPLATDTFSMASLLATKLQDAGIVYTHKYTVDENAIPDGFCKTWIGTIVAENSTWEEPHCRKCYCDAVSGAVCEDPQCDISFHPYLETNCEKWSEDGCCCLNSTCEHDGVRYSASDVFLLTPHDPCIVCECHPSDGLPRCVETSCPDRCVDGVYIPGVCCPICPTGSNCEVLIESAPNGSTFDDTSPVPAAAWRVVTSTLHTHLAWNCTCTEAGGPAECVAVGDSGP